MHAGGAGPQAEPGDAGEEADGADDRKLLGTHPADHSPARARCQVLAGRRGWGDERDGVEPPGGPGQRREREDRTDDGVWAITCLFVRAGHRRRGVSRALAVAAVAHARERGARAVEAYPLLTRNVIDEELHVGTLATFEAAGLREVTRPTPRRMVMRLGLGR
ncbi:GNAT family N-acetyltransferase [Ornithinimicrobium avium]|uniref:GNAT family N-acetyltransferase n=1 Tax=Ornithinimicrobium avium TaxID=2283195 RepID=A0A345NMU4_9MICO|nr:GNAT family N-acetyltransferase [Ornithinimicrobium avium]AXH96352.1 GNAT family N-acetyltransferase [Ornithinimicrobium avium]